MTKDEALRLALEAIEQYLPYQRNEKERIAWEAINSAMASPPWWANMKYDIKTEPSFRKWADLTEEDFVAINQSCTTKIGAASLAAVILKDKNTN
jgi:hypothetical protein